MRIGILYICTGKYDIFWKDFYLSTEKHFMASSRCTREYYVFTDSPLLYGEQENNHIHRIEQKNLGWPDNTLKRFHIFLRIKEQLMQETDYLFFFNANLLFMQPVGSEILPGLNSNGLVGTIHPGFFNSPNAEFTYERNNASTAYIPMGEGVHYYAGGLSGGRTKPYLELCETIRSWVDKDALNQIIPIWHDESLINKYFLDNPPAISLSPAYLYPEGWTIPFDEIIVIRDKSKKEYGGHKFLRRKNSFLDKIRKIFSLLKKE
ncbi:family 6 glucosyltransferase [Bacteroides reticulotermitis]|mgnify:CR=1 FL=1|uniref:family 6 glucosyltransferase n=1 Tax=Bacteroides reticulotermitis TaxID=1133319 RepID=UPI003A84C20F